MKIISNQFIQVILLCALLSCKKTSPIESVTIPPITKQKTTDSVSFNINGIPYSFNAITGLGVGNSQINIKPFDEAIADRKYAYITAGKFWYGTPDSTMYSAYFSMIPDRNQQQAKFEMYFIKKYKTSELNKSLNVMIPKDQSEIFKVGEQPFAIDFEKENTKEGVVLSLYTQGQTLSSTKPGFSIFLQSHRMDIQDNSSFEILKVDRNEGNNYIVEAHFSMNLFDENEKLYRVDKGFLRMNIDMARNGLYWPMTDQRKSYR